MRWRSTVRHAGAPVGSKAVKAVNRAFLTLMGLRRGTLTGLVLMLAFFLVSCERRAEVVYVTARGTDFNMSVPKGWTPGFKDLPALMMLYVKNEAADVQLEGILLREKQGPEYTMDDFVSWRIAAQEKALKDHKVIKQEEITIAGQKGKYIATTWDNKGKTYEKHTALLLRDGSRYMVVLWGPKGLEKTPFDKAVASFEPKAGAASPYVKVTGTSFSFDVPKAWSPGFKDVEGKLLMIYYKDEEGDLQLEGIKLDEGFQYIKSMDDFVRWRKASQNSALKGMEVVEESEIPMAGEKGYYIKTTWDKDGARYEKHTALLLKDRKQYMVVLWGPEGKTPKEVFLHAVKTFTPGG